MSFAAEFVEVHRRRGVVQPLRGISFAAPAGAITAVVWSSEPGKSLLHRMAAGLERPEQGAVIVLGADISRASGRSLRKLQRRVGVVFGGDPGAPGDGLALFEQLSVRDNVAYGVKAGGRSARRGLDVTVDAELGRVGLAHLGAARPAQLSLQQRRRLALARALALRAPLTLVEGFDRDHDAAEVFALGGLLADQRDARGAGAVVFCRHRDVAEAVADEVVDVDAMTDRGPAYEGPLSELMRR